MKINPPNNNIWRGNNESETRTVLICNSVREYMAEVTALWKSKDHREESSQEEYHRGDWVVFPTFKEFDDVALGKTKSRVLDQYVESVTQSGSVLRRLFNFEQGESNILKDDYDITGFYVDVGRFLDNEPECFMNTNKPVNELIDIHVCGGIHCYTGAAEYMTSVKLLAKLVYILKAKGCNARIFYYIEGTYGAAKMKVKDFKDTLDLRSLIITQMPDFFRRYGFLLFELDPYLRSGYGRIENGMFKKWEDEFSKNTLSINLLRADSLRLSEGLLEQVARERDIRKIVKLVNGSAASSSRY